MAQSKSKSRSSHTLAAMYQHMFTRAFATGSDQRTELSNGAWMAVSPTNPTAVLVVFGRYKCHLGATELQTFYSHCRIPGHARRHPHNGKQAEITVRGKTSYIVGYSWQVKEENQ